MTCRAPAPLLDPLFERWPAGEVIHVIHHTRYSPHSFNPGVNAKSALRNPTRVAPIRDRKSKVVPYLYGGSTCEGAIFETVFHSLPLDAPDKFVDLDDFAQRGHGQLVPKRDLYLVDLTTDGLHRLKVPKQELITSAPIDGGPRHGAGGDPVRRRGRRVAHRQGHRLRSGGGDVDAGR